MKSDKLHFPLTLHADKEHGGIRVAVLVLLAVAGWLSYLLLNALIRPILPDSLSGYAIFLACLGAVPLGLGIVWVAEQGLKQVWHSGRSLTLDEEGIHVSDKDQEVKMLNWSENLAQINWYFSLADYARGGRERRVPGKWFCFASQLRQDDERLIAFTYVPPKKAESWAESNSSMPLFHQIDPADVYETTFRARLGPPARPAEIPASVLRGPDGPYWLAEQRRWQDGFELTGSDFETFIHAVYSQKQKQSAADRQQYP